MTDIQSNDIDKNDNITDTIFKLEKPEHKALRNAQRTLKQQLVDLTVQLHKLNTQIDEIKHLLNALDKVFQGK